MAGESPLTPSDAEEAPCSIEQFVERAENRLDAIENRLDLIEKFVAKSTNVFKLWRAQITEGSAVRVVP